MQRRKPFSAVTTTDRGERQSCDHWHEGFCWCYHISRSKEKAIRLVPAVQEKENLGAAAWVLPAFSLRSFYFSPWVYHLRQDS